MGKKHALRCATGDVEHAAIHHQQAVERTAAMERHDASTDEQTQAVIICVSIVQCSGTGAFASFPGKPSVKLASERL